MRKTATNGAWLHPLVGNRNIVLQLSWKPQYCATAEPDITAIHADSRKALSLPPQFGEETVIKLQFAPQIGALMKKFSALVQPEVTNLQDRHKRSKPGGLFR
jgi:hypothetical protein